MSSNLEYKKEFETLILTGNATEALKAMVPGSLQELFIKFNEEFRKCASEKKISEQLLDILKQIDSQRGSQLFKECDLKRMLIEYDFPSTTESKKKEIIDSLNKQFYNSKFDHVKPDIATNISLGTEKPKFPNVLTDETIDEKIEKIIKENRDILYPIKARRLLKRNQLLETMTSIPDDYIKILTERINFPFYLLSVQATKTFAQCIKNKKMNVTSQFPFDQFTIKQLEILLGELNESLIDMDLLLNSIINKKYESRLTLCEGNDYQQREILLEIFNYASQYPNRSKYCSSILLLILQKGIVTNNYDLELFLKFLKNPIKDYSNRFFHNSIPNYTQTYSIGKLNAHSSSSNQLIESYLQYFFINDKAKIKDFETYLILKSLQAEEMKARILRGDSVPRDSNILSKDDYDTLCKRVEITLCEHNKDKFAIDEDVILDIDIKNVPVLYAKIFEINTENYYQTNKKPITSLINVEGLITKLEDTYSFSENPQKLIRKKITFEKIPKRRGVFIIELLGNGISSRIIIKKGNLSIISRSTGKGKLCYILDEKLEISKGNTGLWYRGSKYTCHNETGLIVIPYQSQSGDSTVVLFNDSFADIADLDVPNEKYELKGEFHINHESIITGNTTKVILRPMLLINGRETLLSYMKKSKVLVKIEKEENSVKIPIVTTIDNFQLTNPDDIDITKQFEFEIQIPPQMKSLQLVFECEVFNHSQRKFDNLSIQKTITIDNVTSLMNHFFLKKSNQNNYTLALIGKNGEIRDNEIVNLHLNCKDVDINTEIKMQTNDKGEIELGKLTSIQQLTATSTVNGVSRKFLINNSERFSYPTLIDTIKGQKITLPYQGKESDINLIKINNFDQKKEVIELIQLTKDNLNLERLKTPAEDDYQLTLSQFDIGRYVLYLNYQQILIEVHNGQYWQEGQNFIITTNKLIENSSYQTPIFIKEFQLEEKAIKFKTYSLSKNTLANVYLFQYLPHAIHYFPDKAKEMLQNTKVTNEQTYQQWKNIYLSNRTINEEIQYVLDRKNYEQSMGNSLEMPSLLLKRQFTKDSTLDKEIINQGSNYEKKDAKNPSIVKEKAYTSNENTEPTGTFTVSDFQNFISQHPFTELSISPNKETGEFVINLPSTIDNWGHCHIVCFDDKSVCSEMFQINNPKDVIKRTICLDKALNNEKNYTEIRKTELVNKGGKITISEISSYGIIDSITNVLEYILIKNPNFEKDLKEIYFLIENMSDEDSFLKKLSQHISHEVNIFIYFKYPELFEKFIKPILKYKFEKTFIDYFLLDDMENIKKYITVENIHRLNVFELCLLIMKISQEMPDEAKKIRNIIKKRVKTDNIQALITKNFDILMNMKPKSSEDKEERRKRMEEMEIRKREERKQREYQQNRYTDCREQVRQPMSSVTDTIDCNVSALKRKKCEKMPQMCQGDVFSEKSRGMDIAFMNQIQMKPVEYDKPGCAKEYKERHYLFKNHKTPLTSPFWLEFADHLISNHSPKQFLSKYILYNEDSSSEIMWILSVLDLPIASIKHVFKRVEQRQIEITASSNMIIFTKEISEGNVDINKSLLISQNIREYNKADSIDTSTFKKLTIYTHETIVTNISSSKNEFELFIQIPEGAIPMHSSYYTQTHHINLDSYITTSYMVHFYFPNEGVFVQYHPVATIENKIISIGKAMTYKVQSKKTYQPSSNSDNKLELIIANGNTKDILEYFKAEVIKNNDLRLIFWLLKDKEFYSSIIDILRKKGFFNREIWGYGFYHYDELAIREFLNTQNNLKTMVGFQFDSGLVKVNNTNNFNIINHLEYAPLFNARTHLFGKNTSSIMNKEFKETYQKFIISLLSLSELDAKSLLRLTYYLILQDRIEEAIKVFEKIKIDKEKDNNNYESFMIQYDYINSYLDFSIGFPKFEIARENCTKYKKFPILFWRELFEEIEDELIEYDGKEKVSALINAEDGDLEPDMKKMKKEIKAAVPKLTFKIENKNLQIIHSNITEISIKFYLIDLEILFSRNPFISSSSNDFSFVKPNYTTTLKIESKPDQGLETLTVFEIPKDYVSKNIFIEVSSQSIKTFETYFSADIQVVISESLGELKVCDNKLVPLRKAYIKCFAKMNDDTVKFYKDGYTDLRGLFNYLSLNTNQIKTIYKLSIFICHDENGSVIKECYPPYNINRETNEEDEIASLQRYKQEQRTKWRVLNK